MNGTQKIYDRTSTQKTEYIGIAASGVDKDAEQWQIVEITYDDGGKPLTEKHAVVTLEYS